MKYFYTLLLITAITFNLQAQRNFKPGYIVTLNGDTTKGFVDHKEWNHNPGEIAFKTTEQAAAQQYSPDNIKAFGVDQSYHYEKYTGPISKAAVDLADLSTGIDTSFTTASVFLKIITSGNNLTLYNYSDKTKDLYFIADKNSAAVELKRYVYLDKNQADKIREYNLYIQQLLAFATKYVPGNAALAARINSTRYRLSDIKAIVLQLNNNTDNYKNNDAAGGGAEFFIGAGANMANASFFGVDKSTSGDNIFNANTNVQSVGPLIAAGMNFYLNKSVKKLFFKVELNLAMNKIRATYNSTYTGFNKVGREEELTFNQLGISAVPQLAYNIYNTENLKFFVAAGFQLNFSSFSNTHYYGTNTLNGQFVDKKDNPVFYKKITTSITAKTGVTLANKFDIYLGYGSPVAITDHKVYGVDLSYYRLGINYLLGKK
jgi:hypothetical protein